MTHAPNTRLRAALDAAGLTRAQLAEAVEVDPKSVERWITRGRLPHAATRLRVAQAVGADETYLWPALVERPDSGMPADIVQVWLSRDVVPGHVWQNLVDNTRERLDVLAFSGGFLVETFRLAERVAAVSAAGGRVRIALGDPASPVVAERGVAEGLPSLPNRAASTAEYLAGVKDLPGVDVRVHETPLYASIYAFDDDLLVNPHTHGLPAKDNPVLHLRAAPGSGGLADYYRSAFERVWDCTHA
ncbi:helix-turn-helix transcriptional regulator [Dermacoccus nishinomiyaensis]